MSDTNKNAFYKIFDSSGTFLKTWNDDVVSTPSFIWSINGSMGEMSIRLARKSNNFGETEDVAMFNKVDTYVQDIDAINGVRIHSGFISGYNIVIEESGKEFIDVRVISFTAEADKLVAKDGDGNTTLVRTTEEPADIMKFLLNSMAKTLTYNSNSIDNTDTVVSYTFKYTTFLQAIKKVIELTPAYWFWYVDADNLVQMHQTDFNTIDHNLFVGREIQSINFFKNIESLYNTVFFLGGGEPNLYKKYTSDGSITENGSQEFLMQDTRVTNATTSETMAQKFLDERDHFEQQLTAVVIDSNGSDGQIGGTKGYDIESFRPGDVVSVSDSQTETKETLWFDDTETLGNFVWDESFWDFDISFSLGIPMQIQSIRYDFHTAILSLSTKLPDVPKRIEDIDRNLVVTQSDAIPTIPS